MCLEGAGLHGEFPGDGEHAQQGEAEPLLLSMSSELPGFEKRYNDAKTEVPLHL